MRINANNKGCCSQTRKGTIAWKGLGYYRRARNLLKAAQTIALEYQGKFPKDYETLISINGIGPYTASALRALGHGEKDLAVDANLERVLARYFGYLEKKGPHLQKKIKNEFKNENIFNEIPAHEFRHLNESLMDLGRVLCQARRASCELCPLKESCYAY
jgi:A/G-specific adenine glycosylase